jgi:hypothetical protein
MIKRLTWVLLLVVASSATNTQAAESSGLQSLASTKAETTEGDVRKFMAQVAFDVTQDGPLAWLKHFENGPAFFMAVNGQLAFPDSNAAEVGTKKFAQGIRHLELKWGQDLRVDPLSAKFAVVAASWREIQIDSAGHRVEESGMFTGLVELRDGRWQFRDAHWSSPLSLSPTR